MSLSNSQVFIAGFSRRELIEGVNLAPDQPLTESTIQFHLQQQIQAIIADLQNPEQLGHNQVLSISVTAYPIADDTEFMISILYQPS